MWHIVAPLALHHLTDIDHALHLDYLGLETPEL